MNDHAAVNVALADVPEGGMHVCSAPGREILICRTKDGVYAVGNICTHAYARLSEGRLRGTRIICPLHGASFDIRDGRALGAPANKPLPTYEVALVDGRIEISATP